MRSPQVQAYVNALLLKGGHLQQNEEWTLVPRVQVEEGVELSTAGVSRLDIVPIARLLGDAPSALAAGTKRSKLTAAKEEKLAHGSTVLELLRVLGASDADLTNVRGSLSSDLGLEARVVITVRKDARKTDATLDQTALSQAIASLEEANAVTIVSPDTRQRGKLVTLSRTAEIGHDGGLLNKAQTMQALAAALQAWSAGGIDMDGN